MGRKQAIFPIALACSLGLHAVGMDLYVRYGSFLIQPVTRPVRPRTAELVLKIDPQMMDFGEATGRAIGSNKSPGDQPMLAREADEDQALLSREPEGAGKLAAPAADIAAPPGGGNRSVLASPAVPAPPPEPSTEARSPAPAPAAVAAVKDLTPREPSPQAQVQVSPTATEIPTAPQVVQAPAPAPTPPAPVPVQVAAVAPSPDPRPGAPTAPGLPIPQTDSDSDPFSRIGDKRVVFRNGRLDVQLGRKVKTVRPQIGIGGELDALGMPMVVVAVEVHIGTDGHVTQVELIRKSGSVAIDEPTRNALYLWEFEPTHDKAGRAIPDVLYFRIEYR